MKRLLALFLCLVCALAAAPALAEEPLSFTMTSCASLTGEYADYKEDSLYKYVADKFNIDVDIWASGWDVCWEKDNMWITNGTMPDVMFWSTYNLADYLSITAACIQKASITEAEIADASITAAKIALATITSAQIAKAAIATANIADLAVTAAKIADATITSAKIAQAAIGSAHMPEPASERGKNQGSVRNCGKSAGNSKGRDFRLL